MNNNRGSWADGSKGGNSCRAHFQCMICKRISQARWAGTCEPLHRSQCRLARFTLGVLWGSHRVCLAPAAPPTPSPPATADTGGPGGSKSGGLQGPGESRAPDWVWWLRPGGIDSLNTELSPGTTGKTNRSAEAPNIHLAPRGVQKNGTEMASSPRARSGKSLKSH